MFGISTFKLRIKNRSKLLLKNLILIYIILIFIVAKGHSETIKDNTFTVYLWPYQTDIKKNLSHYQELGIKGYQIDRGKHQGRTVEFINKYNIPYYVGHLAGKGYLHLTGKNRDAVLNKSGLTERPYSFSNPQTLKALKKQINENLYTAKSENVVAYAFDDEISLGSFTNPCDVDVHRASIQWFRQWLKKEYNNIEILNNQYGSNYKDFNDVMPEGYEEVRTQVNQKPVHDWNLSAWIDFRHFMDYQFSFLLKELVEYTNSLDPKIPAGIVGGLAPSPWGGYDYGMINRAVQWIEAYDIYSTNEILRSWWSHPKKMRMQTFFTTKDWKLDSWFLWYYMLHGNQGVIAWPEGWLLPKSRKIAPEIKKLSPVFKKLQGRLGAYISDKNTILSADPIGIYYSHPSLQVSWAMDAIVHGKTWPNRKSSIDDQNQSKGILRVIWCKVLEDLGFQYDFINYLDVKESKIALNEKFKVIILPKTISLSKLEAESLIEFVNKGGILIADYLCGLLDEHGKAYPNGILDNLFGIERIRNFQFLDGKSFVEIDGERYKFPFLERLVHLNGALRYNGIAAYERGVQNTTDSKGIAVESLSFPNKTNVLIKKKHGKGESHYLNLCPFEYYSYGKRFSEYGNKFRTIIKHIINSGGLFRRVKIYEYGKLNNMIESLFWENNGKIYLCLIKNPVKNEELKTNFTGDYRKIKIKFPMSVTLVNLETSKNMGFNFEFSDDFIPWEGKIYEIFY